MEIQAQFVSLREYLNSIGRKVPECCRATIGQILPRGRMFDLLKLGSSMDVDKALRSMHDNLGLFFAGPDERSLASVTHSVQNYLQEAEACVLQTIDLSSPTHQAFLLVLRELYTPPKPSKPTVFLIAGPSASGKDFVTREVFEALRARGYFCQFVLKYIQRESRPEERSITPFLRYQILVTAEEFSDLERMGEVVCPYSKYGSRYGFSQSDLERLIYSKEADANICIMSAFEQADEFIRYLNKTGFRVIPVLLHARLDICRARLLRRLWILREDQKFSEDKGVAELWLRAEEVARDISMIESREPVIEKHYQDRIANNYEHDNRPIQELYRFIITRLQDEAAEAGHA